MSDDTPKIIVDDDWKEEARKEKEEAHKETQDMPKPGEIPEASFVEIIQMILPQAVVGLGGAQDPQSGQPVPPNLPYAKHFIDLLGLLQEKTKGNLTEEEQKLLDDMLKELRMAFVQVSSAMGKQEGSPAADPPATEG